MSILNSLKKKIEGAQAQINPFDGGRTYSSVNAPRQNTPPMALPLRPAAPMMQMQPLRQRVPTAPGILGLTQPNTVASYLNAAPTGRDVMSYLNVNPNSLQGGYLPQQAGRAQLQPARMNMQGGRYYSGLQVQPSYLNLQ